MNPLVVPMVLVRPNKTPAKSGAMSRWLTLKPAMVNPDTPTARVSRVTVRGRDSVKHTASSSADGMIRPRDNREYSYNTVKR